MRVRVVAKFGESLEGNERGNKTVRTSPGIDKSKEGVGAAGKKREEKGDLSVTKKDEEDGALLAILREIRDEMRDLLRNEMRERMSVLEKRWRKKEERIEERMDKIKGRLSKIERRSENITKEATGGKMDEFVGKVAEMFRKRERNMKEKKNNLAIRGLHKEENKSLIDTAETFLEKELCAKAGVKKMRSTGKEKREMIIVEMDCWESKDNIIKEKKKLGSRKIFIDHDLTFEDRQVQRRIKEGAWKEKTDGKWVKIGYRKLEMAAKFGDENQQVVVFKMTIGKQHEWRRDKDFWNYIVGFDYIGLCETWLEDKGWDRIKDRLPETHSWKNINAVRERRKGRAKGGLLIGIDLGTTFDKVDKEELNKIMERTGEIYQGMRNVVRINNHTTSKF
ncbi:hypothetical protein DBV15_12499 [Temnothorax longispinosus]|uniref:Uncharacterized protein n=1 Tax=Temnothorax longispinosus TaxID=300112 RepID=A0A4S2KPL2_9HYME|nr:hypothetical protein DBV15_12499 [Temnothorax longispinosus]